jgi:hypothetical protein
LWSCVARLRTELKVFLQASAPKCPASFDVDITEVDNYVVNIHEFLINNMKILNSEEVMKV